MKRHDQAQKNDDLIKNNSNARSHCLQDFKYPKRLIHILSANHITHSN